MEQKILGMIEDLDVRRELGLLPRRLKPSRLELSFGPHKGLVWNPRRRTLYNFTNPGYFTTMCPVTMDLSLDGLSIFNMYEEPYTLCTYWHDGSVLVSPRKTPWATEREVRIVTFSKRVRPKVDSG